MVIIMDIIRICLCLKMYLPLRFNCMPYFVVQYFLVTEMCLFVCSSVSYLYLDLGQLHCGNPENMLNIN